MDGLDESLIEDKGNTHISKWKAALLGLLVTGLIAVAFVVGYVVGGTGKNSKASSPSPAFDHFHRLAMSLPQKEQIEENLRFLSKKTHLAGSTENNNLAKSIELLWKEHGLDKVEMKRYSVMLSYPKESGRVTVIDKSSGLTIFKTHPNESRLWPDEHLEDVVVPFNAYSPAGNVTSQLVYANYGTLKDFLYLKSRNISCSGNIVVIRYGRGFRANKIELATREGAVGVILYSDPKDYSAGAAKYPDGWWLPPDGVQRGTILPDNGDPLTRGYPATDGTFRDDARNVSVLPSIPVHPLSFEDAQHILSCLDGEEAPSKWQGGLNLTYRLNMQLNNSRLIQLSVSTENTPNQPITDVIGTIWGTVEPDREVILGNHRDAWVTGAVDPSSGTAVLLEIARSLGVLLKEGWRPRRTIRLCSWDAEEYGLIGSTEWVEDNAELLTSRAVTYINVDSAVQGNFTLFVRASSQLTDAIFSATKMIADPDEDDVMLYDTWKRKTPSPVHHDEPRVTLPGSGSDFKPFYCQLGIPVAALMYVFDWNVVGHVYSYPVYHSIHDSFHWVRAFGGDSNFTHHVTLTKVWMQLALSIADSTLLPFNFTRYGKNLLKCANKFASQFEKELYSRNITTRHLINVIDNFTAAATTFHSAVTQLDQTDVLRVRIANDQMMRVERAFLNPDGQPQRPFDRHVIYSPSRYDAYTGQCFPMLTDTMTSLINDWSHDWRSIEKQLSVAAYYVSQGTATLASLPWLHS